MRLSFALVATVSLAALAASPADARKKQREQEREYFAPTVVAQPAAPAANGSIFQTSVGYTPLTSGARATSVGDIITIVLVEQNFRFAASVADRHYVVEQGKVADMIPNSELDANIDKLHAYLGV